MIMRQKYNKKLIPPNIWRIFSSLFSVIKSKNDEPRGELSLLKLSRGEDASSALAKERRGKSRATSSLYCYAEPKMLFSVS